VSSEILYHFTGKEREKVSGSYYFGARYYHPEIGRWMSVDKLAYLAHEKNFESPYIYVNNNPYVWLDKNGNAAQLANDDKFVDVGVAQKYNQSDAKNFDIAAAAFIEQHGVKTKDMHQLKSSFLDVLERKYGNKQGASTRSRRHINTLYIGAHVYGGTIRTDDNKQLLTILQSRLKQGKKWSGTSPKKIVIIGCNMDTAMGRKLADALHKYFKGSAVIGPTKKGAEVAFRVRVRRQGNDPTGKLLPSNHPTTKRYTGIPVPYKSRTSVYREKPKPFSNIEYVLTSVYKAMKRGYFKYYKTTKRSRSFNKTIDFIRGD
jgi:RHS repeat-associated protein